MAADGYVRDGEQAGKAHKIIEEIKRRRRHSIHLNRCRLLNYLVHGTVPLFSFSFGLLRFLRTFVSLFLWRWISHHIWLAHLILIPLSMIWIVTCVLRELEKNECNYVFGGLYLSFLNIVLGKSLRFWWLVPSFPSILFLPFFCWLYSIWYMRKSQVQNEKIIIKELKKQ